MADRPDPWRRLREAVVVERRKRHWSQRKLATEASVSRPTISNLETGNTEDPERPTIERVALAFGWTDAYVEELLRGTGPLEAPPRDPVSRDALAVAKRALPGASRVELERYAMLLVQHEEISEQLDELEGEYRQKPRH